MDILSNLLTSSSANTIQSNDLSSNFSIDQSNDIDDELLSLDPSQGIVPQFSGQHLPQDGNQQPIVIGFSALLKQEIGFNQNETSLEPEYIPEQANIITAKLQANEHQELSFELARSSEDILDQQDKHDATDVISTYEADKTLIQHSESFAQLIKKPIQLKEVSVKSIDENVPNEIARSSQGLSDESVRPAFFEPKSDGESSTEQNTDNFELTQEEKGSMVNRESGNKIHEFKEISIKANNEDSKLSLKNEIEDHQNKITPQADSSGAEYQIAANQTVVRRNEVMNATSVGEQMIKRETFEQDLSQKLQLMLNAQENSAKFDISPADLGKIEIKIVQDVDKTHITFLASSHETQELIESSLQRLKEQVEMHGLNLGNVTVSHGDAQRQQEQPSPRQINYGANSSFLEDLPETKSQNKPTLQTNGLDIFV